MGTEVIKRNWAILLLIILYMVGTIGFLIPSIRAIISPLTPVHLLVTAILLVFHHPKRNIKFWYVLIIIGLIGFSIEWIGVQTGVLFGHYKYGANLGFKLFDVPLMIGTNWILLVYLSADLSKKWGGSILVRSIFAGCIMTSLDFFIEPFAMQFDLWSWADGKVPFQNYLMWFIAGTGLNFLYQRLIPEEKNPLSSPLFLLMAGFFIIIDLVVIW